MPKEDNSEPEVSSRSYKAPDKLHSPALPLLWLLMPFLFCLLYGLFAG